MLRNKVVGLCNWNVYIFCQSVRFEIFFCTQGGHLTIGYKTAGSKFIQKVALLGKTLSSNGCSQPTLDFFGQQFNKRHMCNIIMETVKIVELHQQSVWISTNLKSVCLRIFKAKLNRFTSHSLMFICHIQISQTVSDCHVIDIELDYHLMVWLWILFLHNLQMCLLDLENQPCVV